MKSKSQPITDWLFIYALTKFAPTGISSQVRPSRVRPHLFFQTVAAGLNDSAPLFEEKWDLGPQALISNIRHPRRVKRTCTCGQDWNWKFVGLLLILSACSFNSSITKNISSSGFRKTLRTTKQSKFGLNISNNEVISINE